jgi:uncharacterized protein involved in exopolysaccharide biosynthesis
MNMEAVLLRQTRPSLRKRPVPISPLSALAKRSLLWRWQGGWRPGRYALTFGLPVMSLWLAVIGYIVFTPPSYTSQMNLNLPGSANSSNISLNEIGQASTNSGNPFNSSDMIPKVIYKSLAESAHVRGMAAKRLGRAGMLPKPQIKLLDETSIMQVSLTSDSPLRAQEEAKALLSALQTHLQELREDETQRKSESVRLSLNTVSNNLSKARDDVLALQKSADLVSHDQFVSRVAQAEQSRNRLSELRADLSRKSAEAESFSSLLGIDPEDAAIALKIQGDVRFSGANAELSSAMSEEASYRSKWGSRHPKVLTASQRTQAARKAVQSLAAKVGGKSSKHIIDNLILGDSKDRAELFRRLVETAVENRGLNKQIVSLASELDAQEEKIRRQVTLFTKLEDLERNHKISEAVFSSALARVDTSLQDIYASYPLLQVLSEPSLPETQTSPKPLYAIAGASLGTVLILFSLLMSWIRLPLLRKILQSV